MKALRIALQVVGWIWVMVVSAIVLFGPEMRFFEVMSPFNVWNFLLTMALLASGLGMLIAAEKLKDWGK